MDAEILKNTMNRRITILSHNGLRVTYFTGGKIIQLKSFIEKLWNEYGQPREKLKFGQHSQPDYEQVQPKAYADLKQIIKLTNWQPSIDINKGIKITVSNLLEKQI